VPGVGLRAVQLAKVLGRPRQGSRGKDVVVKNHVKVVLHERVIPA